MPHAYATLRLSLCRASTTKGLPNRCMRIHSFYPNTTNFSSLGDGFELSNFYIYSIQTIHSTFDIIYRRARLKIGMSSYMRTGRKQIRNKISKTKGFALLSSAIKATFPVLTSPHTQSHWNYKWPHAERRLEQRSFSETCVSSCDRLRF